MEQQIRAQAEGNILHVVIALPRMNAGHIPAFKEQIAAAWNGEITGAVVDMSLVEFVDSSGVGALLGLLRRLPQAKATVVLRGMQPQVRTVFELLRLQRVFQIEG